MKIEDWAGTVVATLVMTIWLMVIVAFLPRPLEMTSRERSLLCHHVLTPLTASHLDTEETQREIARANLMRRAWCSPAVEPE